MPRRQQLPAEGAVQPQGPGAGRGEEYPRDESLPGPIKSLLELTADGPDSVVVRAVPPLDIRIKQGQLTDFKPSRFINRLTTSLHEPRFSRSATPYK